MPEEFNIVFQPDDVTATVPTGTTILAAATQAKVYVNSLCGGDGVCGRCRVIVRDGRAVWDTAHFEIQAKALSEQIGEVP